MHKNFLMRFSFNFLTAQNLGGSTGITCLSFWERMTYVPYFKNSDWFAFIMLMHVITFAKEVILPVFVCLSVCLWVSTITQTVMDGPFWNFEGMSGMAQTTSDSILGVIQQESWILDHSEIFVSMGLKGNRRCRYGAGTWRTIWRWIKVF